MFDLFRSRAKAVRYLLTALLGLVALSMVAYLVPGSGMGDSREEQVVAKIGDETLTVREVQTNIQAVLRGKQIPADVIQHYIPDYINQMVVERAVAYQAARMGFVMTEADVAFAIRSMLPQVFANGGFNKEGYRRFLAQQNLTIEEFEHNVRKQLLLVKMRNIALEGMIVSPSEVENEFRRRNEKVKLEYIGLTSDKLRSQVKASPDEIEAYFKANRALFQQPQKRTFDIVVVDEARISASIRLTDEDLRRAYDIQKDRYRLPERVKVRHILVMTQGKAAPEIPALEAKAKDLLKQIKAGGNFAELAKKNSDDPGSAAKGGDLDWVTRGQMVKTFEDSAFSLKPGQISDIVKTDYGFHIVQTMEREEAHLRAFDAVKTELATERKKQMVYEKLQTAADQSRAELSRNPDQAAQIAQKLGLVHHHIEKAAPGDPIPEIGVNKDFDDAISSLSKGGVTPVIQIAGNKLVVGVLNEVVPARPAELNEVQSQVQDRVLADKASKLAAEKAKEAAEKIKGGAGLAQVAKSLGLEVKTTTPFGPDESVQGIGTAMQLAEAFTKPAGQFIGPLDITGQWIIARIVERTKADMSKLPADRDTILSQLKSKRARERQELFDDGILTQLLREGKVKINQDAIKRITSTFRA